MLNLARSGGSCLAAVAVLAVAACGESLVSSGDPAPAPNRVPAGLPASGPAADSSLATVEEIPGWEEVVRELDYRECAVYWRRAGGEYTLEVAELEYSEEALSDPYHAVQVATFLRPVGAAGVTGANEETYVGVRAHCLFPHTEAGREEMREHLSVMFPAPAPGEEGSGEVGGAQAYGDDDDPVPCDEYESGGKATHQCPEITATGTRSCPVGFDRDEFSGACVSNIGGGPGTSDTTDPGTGGPGGSSPGGNPNDNNDEDDDEEPVCTPDQIAIADEYNDPVAWPCTKFTHAVISGNGTHGHTTGYLTDSYISGSGTVLTGVADLGVSGAAITSDWRCPEGNKLVGGTSLTHVHGRAGDFWAPGFLDEPDGANATDEEKAAARELHAKFAAAAVAAGGRYTAFGHTDGTHKDHIHIFW